MKASKANRPHSAALYREAQRFIPSGVNSPVRAFRAVGGNPVFMRRGRGAWLYDEDGRRYLDFCSSWGPLLFGHMPPALERTLRKTLSGGTSFGTATAREVQLAKKITQLVPAAEKVRLVNSGTEAVMSAIRLARGFTGRDKILKIDGGYHGHVDSLLVKAGSGAATFSLPDSAGVPKALAKLTLTVPLNDIRALEKIFVREGRHLAAMILEPVPANMGVVLPTPEYLALARLFTKRSGALLIFDEVITGFRITPGGAGPFFGVKPDLVTLRKNLGGGFPIAAFAGRRDVMDQLAPAGPVYQAGTLSGNPAAVSAGLWMLETVSKKKTLEDLNLKAADFLETLQQRIEKNGWPVTLNALGSMFTIFFTPHPVTDYASARKSDTTQYARFFRHALAEGIYLAPSQFEANFVSAAHTPRDLARAVKVFEKGLRQLFSRR